MRPVVSCCCPSLSAWYTPHVQTGSVYFTLWWRVSQSVSVVCLCSWQLTQSTTSFSRQPISVLLDARLKGRSQKTTDRPLIVFIQELRKQRKVSWNKCKESVGPLLWSELKNSISTIFFRILRKSDIHGPWMITHTDYRTFPFSITITLNFVVWKIIGWSVKKKKIGTDIHVPLNHSSLPFPVVLPLGKQN